MARTSNIYVRIDPPIKAQAEGVLEKIGIPMSNAVAIFLRQVIMHNGLPFEFYFNTIFFPLGMEGFIAVGNSSRVTSRSVSAATTAASKVCPGL